MLLMVLAQATGAQPASILAKSLTWRGLTTTTGNDAATAKADTSGTSMAGGAPDSPRTWWTVAQRYCPDGPGVGRRSGRVHAVRGLLHRDAVHIGTTTPDEKSGPA